MEITSEQQIKINNIGEKYNLRYIIVHGSFACGEAKKGSDLDIAIYGKKFIDFNTQLKIYSDFADVFGDNRERELDIKTLHDVDPLFLAEVVRKGQLIYGDLNDYDHFVLYAYKVFHDSQDLLRLRDELIKRRMQDLKEIYA